MDAITDNLESERQTLLDTYKQIINLSRKKEFHESFGSCLDAAFIGKTDTKESTSENDYRELLQRKQQQLREGKVKIFVAGQTSAGKSSFLNFLLGKRLLPSSSLMCTKCLCTIENSQENVLIIQKENTHRLEVPIGNRVEETTELLKQYMKEDDVTSINIRVPIPVLRGESILIDTPGVGDTRNEKANQLAQKTLFSITDSVAFIYIIDATQGIEEDRIKRIFDRQVEETKRVSADLMSTFNNTTMFVINKIDQVKENETEVRNEILECLEKACPWFDKSGSFHIFTSVEEMTGSWLARYKRRKDKQELLTMIDKMLRTSPAAINSQHRSFQVYFLQNVADTARLWIEKAEGRRQIEAEIRNSIKTCKTTCETVTKKAEFAIAKATTNVAKAIYHALCQEGIEVIKEKVIAERRATFVKDFKDKDAHDIEGTVKEAIIAAVETFIESTIKTNALIEAHLKCLSATVNRCLQELIEVEDEADVRMRQKFKIEEQVDGKSSWLYNSLYLLNGVFLFTSVRYFAVGIGVSLIAATSNKFFRWRKQQSILNDPAQFIKKWVDEVHQQLTIDGIEKMIQFPLTRNVSDEVKRVRDSFLRRCIETKEERLNKVSADERSHETILKIIEPFLLEANRLNTSTERGIKSRKIVLAVERHNGNFFYIYFFILTLVAFFILKLVYNAVSTAGWEYQK